MTAPRQAFDRSIVEGPIGPAVWRLAWPTMLQNVIAGLQGIIDHAMVGPLRRLHRQRRHRRELADHPRRHRLHQLAVHRDGRARGALRGRGRAREGQPRRLPGVSDGDRAGGAAGRVGYFAAPALLDIVNAAPEVQREALPFLRAMFLGSIGMMMFFMLSGAFRAAGDARTPLRLGVAMTVLTIVFNVVLIPAARHARRGARHHREQHDRRRRTGSGGCSRRAR